MLNDKVALDSYEGELKLVRPLTAIMKSTCSVGNN
jgi:hypothetical protein